MNHTKQCKQCTSVFPDTEEYFRPYIPRGKGIRKTSVGRNTICKECEKLNNTSTRIWKKNNRDPKEQLLLDKLVDYYKVLISKGGQPVGAYAKHIIEELQPKQGRGAGVLNDLLDKVEVTIADGDLDTLEYQRLLCLDLTEEPDVYQEMLESLRERTAGPDGRVKPEYKDKFEAVATRFDEYEDNYEWDE